MNEELMKNVSKSLNKKFKGPILGKFIKAINDYKMIMPNDKIAVCISGGKDSLVLAKCFQELKRHNLFEFEIVFIAMDPGFNEENRKLLLKNCEELGIEVVIDNSRIFDIIERNSLEYPCYKCAKMRRGFLYNLAKSLGCNKIALGHHFDDVIETTLLNIFYAGCFKTMLPKLKSTSFEGMELIRPLYYVKEEDITHFMRYHNIQAMSCGCKIASGELPSKRKEIKDLIKHLRTVYSDVDKCIFKSAENINLSSVLGWNDDEKSYSFLDNYDKEKTDFE